MDECNPNILCVQETWLVGSNRIALKVFHSAIRRDRIEQNRGGVLIFIRDFIAYVNVSYNGGLEAVIARVFVGNKRIMICSAYIPPTFNNDTLRDEHKLESAGETVYISY